MSKKQYYHFVYWNDKHRGDRYILAETINDAWRIIRKTIRQRYPGRKYCIRLEDT